MITIKTTRRITCVAVQRALGNEGGTNTVQAHLGHDPR